VGRGRTIRPVSTPPEAFGNSSDSKALRIRLGAVVTASPQPAAFEIGDHLRLARIFADTPAAGASTRSGTPRPARRAASRNAVRWRAPTRAVPPAARRLLNLAFRRSRGAGVVAPSRRCKGWAAVQHGGKPRWPARSWAAPQAVTTPGHVDDPAAAFIPVGQPPWPPNA
jgi:hypothetical protein